MRAPPACSANRRHLGDDRWAPGVGALQVGELGLECRVDLRRLVGGIEFVERGDQRLGNEPAAVLAEVGTEFIAQASITPPGTL